MSNTENLLIEIGTEELPPKSLKKLASAFKDEMTKSLHDAKLEYSDAKWHATPRRLAIIMNDLQTSQEDKQQQKRGPSITAAFDDDGKPTKATEGFAKSCGVSVDQLDRLKTDKGEWLAFDTVIKGKSTKELLPEMIESALNRLPIAKRMRWGDSEIEFVRPIKWTLILFGNEYLDCEIMGVRSGNQSYGHRFHHPNAITINAVDNYIEKLRNKGHVLADYNERRTIIEEQVNDIADKNNGQAIIDSDLLDEVTALVEWPISFSGDFNPDFLKLPKEVLISSMQDHQKYFPVVDKDGNLLPLFISVANIESTNAELIKHGNERVIQPRLSDASFFWERDLNHGLANHIASLDKVIYQKQLGSLADKSERLIKTASYMAEKLNVDAEKAKRSAELCLCDLLTDMVSEFPDLQGTMGRYYAEAGDEHKDVALAIEEYYLPRFAGDALPSTSIGQCLAISEKIDSLVGIFAIGKAPTGDKDPFGLRRSAIGLLRIIIECNLDIDLKDLVSKAASNFSKDINADKCTDDVYHFLMERMKRYYMDENISADTFESVLAINTNKPLDFHHRLIAVTEFRKLSEAESLAAANKRISNILKKSDFANINQINTSLLVENAEKTLAESLIDYEKRVSPLIEKRDYKSALTELAGLRESIDDFFDNVMVNCEDEATKMNRLALLGSLSALFLQTADISKLQS